MSSISLKVVRESSHGSEPATGGRNWGARYASTHRLRRIVDFPAGIQRPKRVRIYARRQHFVLQWWDRQAKRTLNERVEGDLIDAIARARAVESRLDSYGSAGRRDRRLTPAQLIDHYLEHLRGRANAGELAVNTVSRYMSALAHFRTFAEQPSVQREYRLAAAANPDFQLAFAAYLERERTVSSSALRTSRASTNSKAFVLDTVRAMFRWANDPARGNLLPDGFQNPFAGRGRLRRAEADPFGEPDVTLAMAGEFLKACDGFQLAIFAPMILYGLRACEPALLFREHVDEQWFKVVNMPELAYFTKGRRDKRFPLIAAVAGVLAPLRNQRAQGLLYTRRGIAAPHQNTPLFGAPLATLAAELQRRSAADPGQTAQGRQQTRDKILKQAGALTYDHIEGEFRNLARQLGWPTCATLKDFRHVFCTSLENAGMPEYYRRYFMGQSPGRAAIATYTHLNELHERYQEAAERSLGTVVQAVEIRGRELGLF